MCCEEEHLVKNHAKAEELSFIKAIYTLRLSPALLRELRMAMSRRKKRPVVPAGSCETTARGGPGAPNVHLVSSRASAKPTSWQARTSHSSPPTGAKHLAMSPHLCP
jgi:hypothetical protein